MVNKIIIPSIIAIIIASATGTAYYYDFDDDGENPVLDFDSESISHLEIHFLDVGQGDSTLMITPSNYVILVDGGTIWLDKNYESGARFQFLIPND